MENILDQNEQNIKNFDSTKGTSKIDLVEEDRFLGDLDTSDMFSKNFDFSSLDVNEDPSFGDEVGWNDL